MQRHRLDHLAHLCCCRWLCCGGRGRTVEAEEGDTSNDNDGRDELPLVEALCGRDPTVHVMAHHKDQDGAEGLQDADRNVVDPREQDVVVERVEHGRDGQQWVDKQDPEPIAVVGLDQVDDFCLPVGEGVNTEVDQGQEGGVAADHGADLLGNGLGFKGRQDLVGQDVDTCIQESGSQGDQCAKRFFKPCCSETDKKNGKMMSGLTIKRKYLVHALCLLRFLIERQIFPRGKRMNRERGWAFARSNFDILVQSIVQRASTRALDPPHPKNCPQSDNDPI